MITISMRWAKRLSAGWLLLFLVFLLLDRRGASVFAAVSVALALAFLLGIVSVALSDDDDRSASPHSSPFAYQPGHEFGRWLMFETFALGVAMALQWPILGWLSARHASLPGIVTRSEFAQQTVSVALALGAAVGALLAFLLPAIVLIAYLDYWDLGDSPTDGPQTPGQRFRRAFGRCLRIILGLSQGTIIQDRGKMYRPDGQAVTVCAGPVYLDARDGQVAIVETRGRVSTAVSGRVWLSANQRVTGIADLAEQSAQVVVENAATDDGMIIERFEFTVIYAAGRAKPREEQNDGAPVEEARTAGVFTFTPDRVRENLWRDTPETFRSAVIAQSQSVARTVIGSYDLRQIAILPGDTRRVVEDELRAGLQERYDAAGDWFDVQRVAIGAVALPQEARKELVDRWAAEMRAVTRSIEAQTDKDTMILKGEGQALALHAVEKVKHEVREQLIEQLSTLICRDATQSVKGDSELAKRYLEAIEALTGYLAEDSGRALKLVETLETMAKQGKEVNVDFYINSGGPMQHKRLEPEQSQPPSEPEPESV